MQTKIIVVGKKPDLLKDRSNIFGCDRELPFLMPFRTISHLFHFNPSSAFGIFIVPCMRFDWLWLRHKSIQFHLNWIHCVRFESWSEKGEIIVIYFFEKLNYFEFLFKCRLHLLCVVDHKRWMNMNMKLRILANDNENQNNIFQRHHGRYSISWCITSATSGIKLSNFFRAHKSTMCSVYILIQLSAFVLKKYGNFSYKEGHF